MACIIFWISIFSFFSSTCIRKFEIHAKRGSGTACVHHCNVFLAKRKWKCYPSFHRYKYAGMHVRFVDGMNDARDKQKREERRNEIKATRSWAKAAKEDLKFEKLFQRWKRGPVASYWRIPLGGSNFTCVAIYRTFSLHSDLQWANKHEHLQVAEPEIHVFSSVYFFLCLSCWKNWNATAAFWEWNSVEMV